MKKFAKLFDVGERQLIVYIEYASDADGDDDKYTVHQITDIDYAMLDIAFGGPEAALRGIFDAYDQVAAENFFAIDIVKKAISMEDAA